MASSAISEGIILIASIIVASGISLVVLNQMGVLQSTVARSSSAEKDIALTKVKIVYASNSTSNTLNVWAKNIGDADIAGIDKMDVYLGKVGSAVQIPYNSISSSSYWTLHDPSIKSWRMKDTIQIDITNSVAFAPDTTYLVKLVTSNGVSDDYVFSIS